MTLDLVLDGGLFGDIPGQTFSIPGGEALIGGVVYDYVPANAVGTPSPAATPLPATLPLFATGLGALGLLGWRRKRKLHAALS